jgi:3-oxoacyl-[acyl-carrier protein] reductase
MVGFARECAREFTAYGIRVNTVLPGPSETPLAENEPQHQNPDPDPETSDRWLADILLKRLGRAEEVAQVVRFLCSNASSHITGSVVAMGGGKVIV